VAERLVVAVWRATTTTPEECRTGLLDAWAPEALADESLVGLTTSFARADQGPYTRPADEHGVRPALDALVLVDLQRAHDLDDLPARDLLHHGARRVEVWRVVTREPKRWERTWPDGETAPGLKLVSLMRRADGLGHEQFVRHWTEDHTPLALRHHPGLWNYRQHSVRRAFTPGGDGVDGIAELHFRTDDDFAQRFFDSDEGRRVILADVARFMSRDDSGATLMTELALRTPG
jgi:uncharacterized protein (TIGR02118 family)